MPISPAGRSPGPPLARQALHAPDVLSARRRHRAPEAQRGAARRVLLAAVVHLDDLGVEARVEERAARRDQLVRARSRRRSCSARYTVRVRAARAASSRCIGPRSVRSCRSTMPRPLAAATRAAPASPPAP